MNFTSASNMTLRANAVSTQWTGAAALGHAEIAQQAIWVSAGANHAKVHDLGSIFLIMPKCII
jgi:hypothetical protein